MVTHTSSSLYWSPLRPRIRIYSLNDTNYAAPLYSYNSFTDTGTTTKPIALNFDSQTTNVGTFSVEIEDENYELDPDAFMKGNRIFIECSKDGVTWQPAFKGLVRGSDQQIYAQSGRNLILNGYSFLIRLNERILNTIKESALLADEYDRTDSTMFSNNLLNDLLSTDSHYVHAQDDTQLYSIFKKTNVTSSPITEWIPRLDAQLVTVNDAINSILEFSNGLVMLDPSNDELMLYTPDQITSATSIFLLTNNINKSADDADYTMYPLEPYRYNISYDYPDSGSRLIASIGSQSCNEGATPEAPQTTWHRFAAGPSAACYNRLAAKFTADQTNCANLTCTLKNEIDISTYSSVAAQIRGSPIGSSSQVGSNMTLYRDGDSGLDFPSTAGEFTVMLPAGNNGVTGLTVGTKYYLVLISGQTSLSLDYYFGWKRTMDSLADNSAIYREPGVCSSDSLVWYTIAQPVGDNAYFSMSGPNLVTVPPPTPGPCGSQATIGTDPVFAVAHDRNMSNRLGIVERVISGIPTHIKTAQTLNEYLYNKLYYAAKPRFTFDFPSVSMPNRIPKAGDICAHVDTKCNVGTMNGAIQTGVISSVQYSFEQGSDDALGLRRLSLSTTGIRRGSY
jgi:hypothetical protein